MKRLQVLCLVALSSTLLLFGCGKEEEAVAEPVVEQVIDDVDEPQVVEEPEETDTETNDEDLPPQEGMVRSRITNEWVTEEVNNTRPITVMIPNTKTASQYGISNADVLYECNVEGSITRLMALFQDWSDYDRIGNVRSCRDYYVYWSFEWDAFYVHFGGPFYIDEVINRVDTEDIDGLSSSNFWRANDTNNSTDNAYVDTKGLLADINKLGYDLEYRDGYSDEQHYKFAPSDLPNTLEQYGNSIAADKIDMSPTYPVTNCYFVYNSETGLYDRFQHLSGEADGPHVDRANGKQLAFKNILVQNTYYEVRDQKGYLAFQCHDTTRDGWFFTNGRGIHVNWKKTSDYGATRYYDDAGNEIELNTGKTMVCIVEDGDSFLVNDEKIGSTN
ncbi:MAG: DUF3048 domain-containing protein [Lachnospiraceae bacterium]|nr:DUF3048 domain-containing protein [Lachnospiraceae bacterium]